MCRKAVNQSITPHLITATPSLLGLPQSQLGHFQLILNSSDRAVSKTPKFAHITPVLKSLLWLKMEQRIQYKVASMTYEVLQSEQPSYLHSLLSV